MADTKISAMAALTGAGVAAATDVIPIVDTSATETKKITVAELLIGLAALPLAGGTLTGSLMISATTAGGAVTKSIRNLSASGWSQLVLGNNASANRLIIYMFGGSYGSSGRFQADSVLFDVESSRPVYLNAGDFRFWSGSSGENPIMFNYTPNAQSLAVRSLTELTTIAAAATTDTTIQMPAGAIILSVTVRVTTAIPTATNFTVGDSGSAARFSTAAVSSALNSTDAGTKAGAYYNASALAVRITPDATPAANTGRVRVTINYLLATPPTS